MKRLGVLVVADEILAGHVHESNSHFIAKRVRDLGIKLARVEIASDDLSDIVRSVRRFVFDLDLDYVITSGGLGPTPDDRTMEGIATAVGAPLETTRANLDWMRERTRIGHERGYFDSPEPNAGLLKMARLPKGSLAMPNNVGTALGAIVTATGPPPGRRTTRLFTLPGPPREFERMFEESVVPHLERGPPLHVEELVLYSEESRFFEVLARLEKEYPDVVLGSYPERGQIRIRATGPKDQALRLIGEMREAGRAYLARRAA